MSNSEALKNEVRELLAGKKSPLREMKKIIESKNTGQLSLKIPKSLALASQFKGGQELVFVVNPDESDFENAYRSHFIIYAKEKEEYIK
jgi:hypothetical protein